VLEDARPEMQIQIESLEGAIKRNNNVKTNNAKKNQLVMPTLWWPSF